MFYRAEQGLQSIHHPGLQRSWERTTFASIWTHIDQRKMARYSRGKLLEKQSKLNNAKFRILF